MIPVSARTIIAPVLQKDAEPGSSFSALVNPYILPDNGLADCFLRQSVHTIRFGEGISGEEKARAKLSRHLDRLLAYYDMGEEAFLEEPNLQSAILYQWTQLCVWAQQLSVLHSHKKALWKLRDSIVHHNHQLDPQNFWETTNCVPHLLKSYLAAPEDAKPEIKIEILSKRALTLSPDALIRHQVQSIYERLKRIASFLNKMPNQAVFLSESMMQDVLMQELTVIGEMAKNLLESKYYSQDDEAQRSLEQFNWLRNRLTHPEKVSQTVNSAWLWEQLQTTVPENAHLFEKYCIPPVYPYPEELPAPIAFATR